MIILKRLDGDRNPMPDMPEVEFRDVESMMRCLEIIFVCWAGVQALEGNQT